MRHLPTLLLLAAGLIMPVTATLGAEQRPFLSAEDQATAVAAIVAQHGPSAAERAGRGVRQVAERWWPTDGDATAFQAFCAERFLVDPASLSAAADRLEVVTEQLAGHLHEIRREITRPLDLDTGPIHPVDELLANVDLSTHVSDDLFASKVGFFALLNFPVHTLADRLTGSAEWSRLDWARSRMMDHFAWRVPSAVGQEISQAFTAADRYIAEYNVRLDRLVDGGGKTLFPDGLRLITHWGLRDEIKAQYAQADGLGRQRAILRVMERIVRQEIPAAVIDNAELLWNVETNQVWQRTPQGRGEAQKLDREPDTRYGKLLDVFRAVRKEDPYVPVAPTYIDRRFNVHREIPEREVEALFVSVLESPEFRAVGELIRSRLGRKLEAFDIWYDGFKARGAIGDTELTQRVAARFPDVPAFQRELPSILRELGFSAERANWLAERIVVDPSRGAGHASGAVRREDRAHLRTRFGPQGMDYKGFNIAIHELGHNVEQVFSLNGIDHWWLNGVPNTAFTEALAFVFQARDMELLGLPESGDQARHLEALDTLWATAEIGGVALVDMAVWRWMYAHPQATPAELRQATLQIARDVWNRYYAPVFGVRDQEILAIYSHMIVYGLYLPDYPLGHIIAFQVADRLRGDKFGAEFERVSRQGRLTPDAWMRGAVGQPISAQVLLGAARRGLEALAK